MKKVVKFGGSSTGGAQNSLEKSERLFVQMNQENLWFRLHQEKDFQMI